jgi:hypothetical protein
MSPQSAKKRRENMILGDRAVKFSENCGQAIELIRYFSAGTTKLAQPSKKYETI